MQFFSFTLATLAIVVSVVFWERHLFVTSDTMVLGNDFAVTKDPDSSIRVTTSKGEWKRQPNGILTVQNRRGIWKKLPGAPWTFQDASGIRPVDVSMVPLPPVPYNEFGGLVSTEPKVPTMPKPFVPAQQPGMEYSPYTSYDPPMDNSFSMDSTPPLPIYASGTTTTSSTTTKSSSLQTPSLSPNSNQLLSNSKKAMDTYSLPASFSNKLNMNSILFLLPLLFGFFNLN